MHGRQRAGLRTSRRQDNHHRRYFATLGSVNLDQRSFRLNFEANVFFFGVEVADELERDFLSLCSEAREVTTMNRRGISRRQRLTEGVTRVLAPLL